MNEKNACQRWEVIKNHVPESSVGAELGVFKGHLSSFFLRKNPKMLFLVDPWYRLEPYWSWVKDQDASTLTAFVGVLNMFKDQINEGVVVPVVDFSMNFLRAIAAESLDFVYLDSSHSYEDTKIELELVRLALKPSGILIGDDWHEDTTHRHYGVTRAVKEVISAGKASLVFQPELAQWAVRFQD